MPLGEGRIAGEVGEDDAHLAGAGERLVEVERAVALLVPLRPGDDGDQDERGKHEQVPLPPRELPVARPCDHDHRLGEESERESESEHEPLLPPTMDAQEAEGGDPEERDPQRREEDLPAVQLLGGERVVERGDLEEREGGPDEDARHHDADERRAARRTRSARFPSSSIAADAAKAPASSSPTGVASSKPAFFPRRTPGVASACSPKKLALTMHASEMRRRRASRRRRAAVVTPQLSAVAIAAAPSTIQKCAGWFSQ